jgi:hypothetical protein
LSQDRSKLPLEERIKLNIEDCIGARASADTYDKSNSLPPSMGWIGGIYGHLKALYEIESKLLIEIKQTKELLHKILGAEEGTPIQELNDRAEILGALINRLRNEDGRP